MERFSHFSELIAGSLGCCASTVLSKPGDRDAERTVPKAEELCFS